MFVYIAGVKMWQYKNKWIYDKSLWTQGWSFVAERITGPQFVTSPSGKVPELVAAAQGLRSTVVGLSSPEDLRFSRSVHIDYWHGGEIYFQNLISITIDSDDIPSIYLITFMACK